MLIDFNDAQLLEYITMRVKEQGGNLSQLQRFFFCKFYKAIKEKGCFSDKYGTFYLAYSLTDFSKEFNLSINPVRTYLDVLEQYGLLFRVPTRSSNTYNKYHNLTFISKEFIQE